MRSFGRCLLILLAAVACQHVAPNAPPPADFRLSGVALSVVDREIPARLRCARMPASRDTTKSRKWYVCEVKADNGGPSTVALADLRGRVNWVVTIWPTTADGLRQVFDSVRASLVDRFGQPEPCLRGRWLWRASSWSLELGASRLVGHDAQVEATAIGRRNPSTPVSCSPASPM